MCILLYKVKHNLYPQTICNFFDINCHTYSLRQRDFYLPRFKCVFVGFAKQCSKNRRVPGQTTNSRRHKQDC